MSGVSHEWHVVWYDTEDNGPPMVVGPFYTKEGAEQYDAEEVGTVPTDGGYRFSVVVGPDCEAEDPEDDDDEEAQMARINSRSALAFMAAQEKGSTAEAV